SVASDHGPTVLKPEPLSSMTVGAATLPLTVNTNGFSSLSLVLMRTAPATSCTAIAASPTLNTYEAPGLMIVTANVVVIPTNNTMLLTVRSIVPRFLIVSVLTVDCPSPITPMLTTLP